MTTPPWKHIAPIKIPSNFPKPQLELLKETEDEQHDTEDQQKEIEDEHHDTEEPPKQTDKKPNQHSIRDQHSI